MYNKGEEYKNTANPGSGEGPYGKSVFKELDIAK